MPNLDWIGKKAVVNHHREVHYHLLECNPELSVGDPDSGNLLLQGDNLLALKALLPYYAGRVKCIYIDPPYNTGNEKWVYNDAVNSAEMRAWLGSVVGGEAEDLSRHDKWLCMMYPRLALLRSFLTEDGAIFISIDDNELANLRLVCDEIFGGNNFVGILVWQKRVSPANDARYFSSDHEYIAVYAKHKPSWRPNRLSRTSAQNDLYKNPDNDLRGPWNSVTYTCNKSREERPNLYYEITNPNTGQSFYPRETAVWKFNRKAHAEHIANELIYWGKDGKSTKPRLKQFLSKASKVVPRSLLLYSDVGNTQEARAELLALVPNSPFITPKPVRLLRRILELGTNADSIVLDSFVGSGTTCQAVVEANQADIGHRRFIGVEMEAEVMHGTTLPRLRIALAEHSESNHGFRFCELGPSLFGTNGQLEKEVGFSALARHIFFTETGSPLPSPVDGSTPLLGIHSGVAVYLLFNGVLGDRRRESGNVLTAAVLETLPPHNGTRVVYGESSRLGPARLRREGITFKQVPYEIKVS